MENKKSQFERCDGFNPSVKCDDPIQEKWIHKEYVIKTGETEDDFIVDEKPVLIDKINLQKSIDEEAKTTDLKFLLTQLLMQNGSQYKITGDEPELNKRTGIYGDFTGVQKALENRGGFISADELKSTLPVELQDLSVETLSKLTDQEILDYISKVREKNSQESNESKSSPDGEKGSE